MGRYRAVLVEDNPDHVFLISRAIRDHGQIDELLVFTSAEQALRELSDPGRGGFRPDFLLVDLKLPGMSGQEFLDNLKQRPELADVPIYVLTSSDRLKDRRECDKLGARGYFLKPFVEDDVNVIIRSLEEQLTANQGSGITRKLRDP